MVLNVVPGKRLRRPDHDLGASPRAEARHISVNYLDRIHRALEEMDRRNVNVRFVATGYEDDEDEREE